MARKKKHQEHENLERWLVSYADFITLLFAFFVVMYSVSAVNDGKYKVMSQSMAEAFSPVISMSASTLMLAPEVTGRIATKNPVLIDLQLFKKVTQEVQAIGAEGIKVKKSKDGIVISIADTLMFRTGEADLLDDAKKIQDKLGVLLADMSNTLRVEGHTDIIPIHTAEFPSNWELSSNRAIRVLKYLVEQGVSPERISAAGYAEFQPIAPNDTEEGRRLNRRVDIVIVESLLSSGSSQVNVPLTLTEFPSTESPGTDPSATEASQPEFSPFKNLIVR